MVKNYCIQLIEQLLASNQGGTRMSDTDLLSGYDPSLNEKIVAAMGGSGVDWTKGSNGYNFNFKIGDTLAIRVNYNPAP